MNSPSHPVATGQFRMVGGSGHDAWNMRVLSLLTRALPTGGSEDPEVVNKTRGIAFAALVSMGVEDPVEAMLASQIIVAHSTASDLYRRAWLTGQPFEAMTRFLALADKATRTMAMLTESLDRHRNRGQQKITVTHVTVNADQAIVAETVAAGGGHKIAIGGQPHALAYAPIAPLFSDLQEEPDAVPVSGSSEL